MFDINKIKQAIVDVKDFPTKGILFKDITPIFTDPQLVKEIVAEMAHKCQDLDFDVIIAPESRGYIFGIPLALLMNKPFVFVRKKGKLPRKTISVSYALEYGQAEIEIHEEDLKQNMKVLIVDDLLATGGTIHAIQALVNKAHATVVGNMFLIELTALNGKEKLVGRVDSLLKY